MDKLLRGDEISIAIKNRCIEEIKELYKTSKRHANLSVILIGDDPASLSYINSKRKLMELLDIEFSVYQLKEDELEVKVLALINTLNHDNRVDGIFVQMPLPPHIKEVDIVRAIHYRKDVDGLSPINLGNLILKEEGFIPCTPQGIMYLLNSKNIALEGKKAVVIGRSILVGKPIATLLEQANCTVTICHSKTVNLKAECKQADILIVAVGKEKFINRDYIKEEAIVIDVGINRNEQNKLVGDVDFDDVFDIVSYITPVPKGVGPMTVAMLAKNMLKAFKMHIGE